MKALPKGKNIMAKVLVVDDDEDVRNLIKEYLSKKGYEVLTASSGEESLEKMKEQPAVVLLDVMMPDMHGLKVLDRIKDMSPSTEVIIITGLDEHAIGVESMKRGAFEFVTKPVDLRHLEFLLTFRMLQKPEEGSCFQEE